MDWTYNTRERCWELVRDGWQARVGRWPGSLEHTAQVTSPAPARRVVHGPHVFAELAVAQGWCLEEIARQGVGSGPGVEAGRDEEGRR